MERETETVRTGAHRRKEMSVGRNYPARRVVRQSVDKFTLALEARKT